MSTEQNEQPQPGSETTVSATSSHPAIVEPTNPINGPRIHLYTSLSSGSSYVPPPTKQCTYSRRIQHNYESRRYCRRIRLDMSWLIWRRMRRPRKCGDGMERGGSYLVLCV